MCFEFMVGFPPFMGQTLGEVFQNITSRSIQWPDEEQLFQPITDADRAMVEAFLTLNAKDRPLALQVKANPWFDTIQWATLLDQTPCWVPAADSQFDTRNFATDE